MNYDQFVSTKVVDVPPTTSTFNYKGHKILVKCLRRALLRDDPRSAYQDYLGAVDMRYEVYIDEKEVVFTEETMPASPSPEDFLTSLDKVLESWNS